LRCKTRIALTLVNVGNSGAQADDSIILHFLLDSRGNYDVLGADYRKQPDHRACKLPIFKEFMSTEDVSGLSMIRQHMKKNGAEQLWVGRLLYFSLKMNSSLL